MYTPHVNQRLIHNSINREPYKYYSLRIGRQFGKSMLAQNQAVDWICNSQWSGAWVSPTYKQAKKVSDEMNDAYNGLFQYNRSELTLKAPNGCQIQFFSSERYDNIRGFTFDFLIIDEAAHQQEEAWTEVLRATVLVRGKKVLFISTPKGRNWFYNITQMDGVNSAYKSFHLTSYDNPHIDPAEIDGARQQLPDHVFRQEYLAEFIDGGTSPFIEWDERVGSREGRLYAGIDLGRADDWTVLTIVNEKCEMVFCERWRQDSWTNIVGNVCRYLKEYQPQTFIEVNSIGDAIFEQIGKGYDKQKCHPFVTSSKSKQDVIEQLIVCNQHKEASIIPLDWLKKEYDVYTYEYNPKTKNVRYTAPPGFHDDGVMSHALAIEACKKLKTKGIYSVV